MSLKSWLSLTASFFYSAVELDQGKRSHFSEAASSESQLKRREEADPAAARAKEAGRPSSPDHSDRNMTRSVREEAERLMMHDDVRYSSQAPRANAQQVRQTSNLVTD